MTTVTVHYMKNGEFQFAHQITAGNETAQEHADALAHLCVTDADQVQVWFGPLDGRPADATAEVPA